MCMCVSSCVCDYSLFDWTQFYCGHRRNSFLIVDTMLIVGTFMYFVVIVILGLMLLWSTSSPNERGSSRNLYCHLLLSRQAGNLIHVKDNTLAFRGDCTLSKKTKEKMCLLKHKRAAQRVGGLYKSGWWHTVWPCHKHVRMPFLSQHCESFSLSLSHTHHVTTQVKYGLRYFSFRGHKETNTH